MRAGCGCLVMVLGALLVIGFLTTEVPPSAPIEDQMAEAQAEPQRAERRVAPSGGPSLDDWRIERPSNANQNFTRASTGGGTLQIEVHCDGLVAVALLRTALGSELTSRTITVRWDEGSSESYEFRGSGDYFYSRDTDFITKLRRHTEVEVQVTEEIRETLSLRGSAQAIDAALEGQCLAESDQESQRTPDPSAAELAGTGTGADDWDLTSCRTRITERNDVFVRVAWIATVESRRRGPFRVDVEVQFLDSDGFILESDDEYNLQVTPGENQLRGEDLVNPDIAQAMRSTNCRVVGS